MESLYRKYRPQTFADVVGQQHVVGTLERAVIEGRTSHAYLFCGPRGTGKTTMARLLAKALMCEQGSGHLPDGTCEQCSLIAAGEHPDVYELDAASRTGVDNVREEIINRVSYAPVQGRYKVYIIDEVHMLTTAAFNALLKTLEEPPGHVVFVLCTTDPQKIPATILSRVQRFDFRPIGNEDILHHLEFVCEQEGFTYEDAALDLVVRNARGGMRDALSTLEQLSVFGGGVISLDAAQDMLGAVTGAALEQVVSAMAARDVSTLFAQVGALVDSGRDLLQFTRELAARLRDVYVVAVVGTNPAVLPAVSDATQLQAEAASFGSSDRLARILALLGEVSKEMSTAPNQRLVLEIAFTRIARPEADLTIDSLAERVAALERQIAALARSDARADETGAAFAPVQAPNSAAASESASAPAPQPVPTPDPQPAPAPAPQPASAPVQAPSQVPIHETLPVPAPAPEPVSQKAPQPETAQATRPTEAPAPASQPFAQTKPAQKPQQAPQPNLAPTTPANNPGALQRAWRQVVSELVARVPPRGSLLTSAVALSDDGSTLVVGLPKGSSFALKMLERPDVRAVVEGMVAEVFGQRTLAFKEGITADLRLPTTAVADFAPAAPAPAPEPAYAPSLTPAPAPTLVPEPTPAPVATPEPVSAPAPSGYPTPWDDPVPYELVPYDELYDMPSAAVAEPSVMGYEPQPAPESAPMSAPNPLPAPAPVPEPEPAPTPATDPAPKPAPVPAPPSAAPKPAPAPTPDPAPGIPTDLPADLSAILENAFEVFGNGVKISK